MEKGAQPTNVWKLLIRLKTKLWPPFVQSFFEVSRIRVQHVGTLITKTGTTFIKFPKFGKMGKNSLTEVNNLNMCAIFLWSSKDLVWNCIGGDDNKKLVPILVNFAEKWSSFPVWKNWKKFLNYHYFKIHEIAGQSFLWMYMFFRSRA